MPGESWHKSFTVRHTKDTHNPRGPPYKYHPRTCTTTQHPQPPFVLFPLLFMCHTPQSSFLEAPPSSSALSKNANNTDKTNPTSQKFVVPLHLLFIFAFFSEFRYHSFKIDHMGTSVRVKEAVVVNPSEPTPSGVLPLSALDSQLFLRFTVEYLLVYRPGPGLDQVAATARLKAALARALVPYYPFAGRVRPRPDTPGLEVVCRAQGAIFIEAYSDSYTAYDFEKAPRTVTQWRKLLSLYVTDVLKGSPPLVVQLTWLADGAAAVGVGINHALCDGIGSAEFLIHFAELASGKRGPLADPEPKPVWDRHLLNPFPAKKPARANQASHPEFTRVPDLCGFMNKVTSGLKPTSIVFDKRRINELKGLARCTSQPSESPYTSFEVLAAHVWRSWARALGFPPSQIIKILFSINVRNRVKPRLPEGYYGNAFVLGCAQSSARELAEKGIGYGSGLVKRAKERVDGEHVRRVSELVSEWRASPDPVGVLIVSQWSRLGLERVELMGKPIHVWPICCDRYCLFLPVRDERESVRVAVAVPAAAVDNYNRFVRESNL